MQVLVERGGLAGTAHGLEGLAAALNLSTLPPAAAAAAEEEEERGGLEKEWAFVSVSGAASAGSGLEVGAGHMLALTLGFSHPVAVAGEPVIALNLTLTNHTSAPGTASGSGSSGDNASTGGGTGLKTFVVRRAKYFAGAGTSRLVFLYQVQEGDDLRLGAGLRLNTSAVTLNTREGEEVAKVLRWADAPTLTANLSLAKLNLPGLSRKLAIDTSPPVLNASVASQSSLAFSSPVPRGYVVSRTSDGRYAPPDQLRFAVRFSKAVAASEGCHLLLDTGAGVSRRAFLDPASSPGVELAFTYQVQAGDGAAAAVEGGGAEPRVGVWGPRTELGEGPPLVWVPPGDFLRRQATRPTTKAADRPPASTTDGAVGAGLRRLNETAALVADGVTPRVVRAVAWKARFRRGATANWAGEFPGGGGGGWIDLASGLGAAKGSGDGAPTVNASVTLGVSAQNCRVGFGSSVPTSSTPLNH